jgi:hypothetical protein
MNIATRVSEEISIFGASPRTWRVDRVRDRLGAIVGGEWGDEPDAHDEGVEIAVVRVADNLEEGRSALRSCINATIGFEKLGIALGRSPKSLMRMFGPSGNPTVENLLAVIGSVAGGDRRSSASARGGRRGLTEASVALMSEATSGFSDLL